MIWLSIAVVICGLVSTGILTNLTLRSIEKNLPNTLLSELSELYAVLERIQEVVIAADHAVTQPNERNFDLLRSRSGIRARNTRKKNGRKTVIKVVPEFLGRFQGCSGVFCS